MSTNPAEMADEINQLNDIISHMLSNARTSLVELEKIDSVLLAARLDTSEYANAVSLARHYLDRTIAWGEGKVK